MCLNIQSLVAYDLMSLIKTLTY